MTPFQQLRVWLRRASAGQRAMAAAATVVAVAVVGWLVVPVDDPASTDLAVGGLPTAVTGATLPNGQADPAVATTLPGTAVVGAGAEVAGGAPVGAGPVDPAAPATGDPAGVDRIGDDLPVAPLDVRGRHADRRVARGAGDVDDGDGDAHLA